MKLRMISLLLIVAAMASMLVACGSNQPITQEEAKQIVLDDLGLEADQVEIHIHTEVTNGITYYNIYVTTDDGQLAYQIHGGNGKILSKGNSNHSH